MSLINTSQFQKRLRLFLESEGYSFCKYTSTTTRTIFYKKLGDNYIFIRTHLESKRYLNVIIEPSKIFVHNYDYGSVGSLTRWTGLFSHVESFAELSDIKYDNWALDLDSEKTEDELLDYYKSRYYLVVDRFSEAVIKLMDSDSLSQKRYRYLEQICQEALDKSTEYLNLEYTDFLDYCLKIPKQKTFPFENEYLQGMYKLTTVEQLFQYRGYYFSDYGANFKKNLKTDLDKFCRIVCFLSFKMENVESDNDINTIFRKIKVEPGNYGDSYAYIFSSAMTFIEKFYEN